MVAERLFAGLGGALLFLLTGAGIVSLFPGLRTRTLSVRMAFAWLFGVLSVGGGAWMASHLLEIPLRPRLFIALVLLGAVPGVVRLFRRRVRERRSRRPPILALGVAIVIAFVTTGLLVMALSNPLRDWDGRQHWLAAARIVRAEETVDARVLIEKRWFVSHPRYPILVPLAVVAEQTVLGAAGDDRAARSFYVFFYPAWLVLVFHFARRRAGPTAAALSVLAAALPWVTTFELWGGPASAYNDLPLACFLGAGFLLLLERDLRISTGVAAGLLLGGAILTKKEGIPLALFALGAALISETWRHLRRSRRDRTRAPRRLRTILVAAAPAAAALALFVSWSAPIENRFDESYETLSSLPAVVAGFSSSVSLFGPEIPKLMLQQQKWGYFWFVVPIALVAGRRGLRSGVVCPATIFLALASSMMVAAYSVGWAGHADILVRATWNRFLLQISIPGLILLALALRECLRPFRRLRRSTSRLSGRCSTD